LSDLLGISPPGLHRGQAEVADLDREVVVVQENVVALQVAVDDVFGVKVAKKEHWTLNMIEIRKTIFKCSLHPLRRLARNLDGV
jgi:hypothetical protein